MEAGAMADQLDRVIVKVAGGLSWLLYAAHRPLAMTAAEAHNRRCARLRRRWQDRAPF